MIQQDNFTAKPINTGLLAKRMLIGAGIALTLMAFFLSGVDHPNPAWPKYWMLRPLIVMLLAGATGGLCYYFIDHYFSQKGWSKIIAILLSAVIFFLGLFMGFVLGLDGTLWN
jgi:hypothetical protein